MIAEQTTTEIMECLIPRILSEFTNFTLGNTGDAEDFLEAIGSDIHSLEFDAQKAQFQGSFHAVVHVFEYRIDLLNVLLRSI